MNPGQKDNSKPGRLLLEKAAFIGSLTLCASFVFGALPGSATQGAAAMCLLVYLGCLPVILFALVLRNPYLILGLFMAAAGLSALGFVWFNGERSVMTTLAFVSGIVVFLLGIVALLRGVRIHKEQVQHGKGL